MFCPNCGEKLPDGSKFCGSCGTQIEDAAPEQPVRTGQETSAAAQTELVQPKKQLNKKPLIIAAAAAVVVIAVIVILVAVLAGGGSKSAYVYLSDGSYELLTDLKKGESVEIDSSKSDNLDGYQYGSLVRFSPNGKYVYYYSKVDTYSGTGSLNRAEFGKLTAGSSKNDKYIEVIASNVKLGFRFFSDGTLAYQNGDNTLYYYDGEETTSLAKDVASYYIDADENRIMYTIIDEDADGAKLIYGIETSAPGDKIKLASDVSTVYGTSDFDNIFYTKIDDEGAVSLYVVGFEKDSEKVAADVSILSVINGVAYFTEDDGITVSLYDYVKDDKKAEDDGITEPVKDDYSIPRYSYYRINSSVATESDYTELYTACNKDLYWYTSGWYCYSMQEAVSMNWGDYTDQIQAATQSFIDKFQDRADADGYILVTDDVKQALLQIDQYNDEPAEKNWLDLCFYREQTGTTYDYDAYNAAYDVYYEAADRIWLREALQNVDNDYPVKTLYCYADGTLTTICNNMLNYSWYGGAIVYNTTDLVTKTVNLEEIYSIYDVQALFDIDYEAQNYLLPTGTTNVYQMSEDAAYTYGEAYKDGYASLTVTSGAVYMQEDNGTLSVAAVTDGTVEDFDVISDDGTLLGFANGKAYYVSGVYTSNSTVYGDLYSYANGESTRLARDIVYGGGVSLYDDGVTLVYTDYNSRSGYELTMIDKKGEATTVADDVTQYVRIDSSTLLFISDDDLYSYNGKEKTRLASDVDYLWCLESMDVNRLSAY